MGIDIDKQLLSSQLHDDETSLLKRYCRKAVGRYRLSQLLRYELTGMLVGNLFGGLGYALRKLLMRNLFQSVGKGLILGRGLCLRHPGRVSIGDRVAIDDHVLLDASGAGDEGISIGDDVIISRNCVVQGKTGSVRIGQRTDIGCNTILSSVTGIYIEKAVLIAGNCYIGGARYHSESIEFPMMDQGVYSKGPVQIGEGTWIGAAVTVLDGVQIGKGTIIGAGAVVTKDIPDFAIATGVPARIAGIRL